MSSASRPRIADAGGALEPAGPDRRLRDTDDCALGVETAYQLVGDSGCERFEQVVGARARDLLHRACDLAVVDRVFEPVGNAAFADVELHVEEEVLALLLLARTDA